MFSVPFGGRENVGVQEYSYVDIPCVLTREEDYMHIYENDDSIKYDKDTKLLVVQTRNYRMVLDIENTALEFQVANDLEHSVNFNVNKALIEINLLVPYLVANLWGDAYRDCKLPVEATRRIAEFFVDNTTGENLWVTLYFEAKNSEDASDDGNKLERRIRFELWGDKEYTKRSYCFNVDLQGVK